MPLPSIAGLFAPQGVLAAPAVSTNPVQNPLTGSQDDATIAAMAEQRAKKAALEKALYRAQVLREQPGGGFAQGTGVLGIRQGVGPMGYLTSIGDAIAGIIAKRSQKKGEEEVTGAMGPLSAAEQEYARNFLQSTPGGMYGTGYGRPQPSFVAQGSPLSLSDR